MAIIKLEESKGFDLIPEDSIIDVTISNIEISVWTDPATQEQRKNLNWTFTIDTPGEWEGKRIWGNTSMVFNTNPNCKLRNWASAILNTELDAGYQLDTDELIGRHVRAAVGHKDGKNKDGQPVKRQFVSDVLPGKKAASPWGDGPGF